MGQATFSNNSTIKIVGGGSGAYAYSGAGDPTTIFSTGADQYALINSTQLILINGGSYPASGTIVVGPNSTVKVGITGTLYASYAVFGNSP